MKKLTKIGENFIRTITQGNGDSLIRGNYKYRLPFSGVEQTQEFVADAIDHVGNPILTNQQLGEALIFWYNQYAELSDQDANVLAAQGYVESGYRLWHYAQNNSGVGIANLTSVRMWRVIVESKRPQTEEEAASPNFETSEINKITNGLTEPREKFHYIYRGDGVTSRSLEIAILSNRLKLFQNVMNNPDLMIKAQSIVMNEVGRRNDNILTSTLFAYSRDYLLNSTSYVNAVEFTGKKYGQPYTKEGVDYVDFILKCLTDKDNTKINKKFGKPKGIWFGIELQQDGDEFTAFLG